MNKKRVVLAGGSGFLGRALAKELLLRNYEVVVLTRSPRKHTGGTKEIWWDGKNSGGQKAASGVYIALLRTSDKSSSRTVKVVIER